MFDKYTISQHVPILLDYRLSMILQHLIWFEVFDILDEKVSLDIVSLLNIRGYGPYTGLIAPCGRISESYTDAEWYHFRRQTGVRLAGVWKFHSDSIHSFISRYRDMYSKRHQFIEGRRNTSVDQDFFNIWN